MQDNGSAAQSSPGVNGDNGHISLQGVQRVCFCETACMCFPGSLAATLRYLGEEITDEYAMGVTGAAFSILWGMPWCDANCDILLMGDEPIERTFKALGYSYTRLKGDDGANPGDTRESWRRQIVASLRQGRPVIMQGPVGPPECSIITGCEGDGQTLTGWSYFQETHDACFREERWFEQSIGAIIVGERTQVPTPASVLQHSLDWAVKLVRVAVVGEATPQDSDIPQPLMSGLAAYDAFAEALERDEEFPAGDIARLTRRLVPIGNDGVHLMCCKRRAAAGFLRSQAGRVPGCPEGVVRAAEAYEQVTGLWCEAAKGVGWTGASEPDRLRIADSEFRRRVAGFIRQAKGEEERAVACMEHALEAWPGG